MLKNHRFPPPETDDLRLRRFYWLSAFSRVVSPIFLSQASFLALVTLFSHSQVEAKQAKNKAAPMAPQPSLDDVASHSSALPLRLEDQLQVRKSVADADAMSFTSSQSIDGVNDRVMTLKGDAQVRRNGAVVKGDKITYDLDTDILEVEGQSVFSKNNVVFSGPKTKLKLDSQTGWMETPEYEFRDNQSSGKAQRAEFLDEDKVLLTKPIFSTCSPQNLDWYFEAQTIEVDREQKIAVAKDGVLNFKGLPIFYYPSFSIPMSGERSSGLLAPTIGLSSINGLDVTTPYYVNIAPNRDFTFFPRYLSLRGLQAGGEFRYLDSTYSGVLRAEYLPHDLLANRDRWAYSISHQQNFTPSWRAYANFNRVSDDLYADNLGRSLGQAISRQFTQEVGTTYNHSNWNFLARVQKFQTLQPDANNPSRVPYDREPQINAQYRNMNVGGAILDFESDYTRFALAQNTPLSLVPNGGYYTADRAFFNTGMSYPIQGASYFITPKVSVRGNTYAMQGTPFLPSETQNFSLPTISLDSGLFFDRDAKELTNFFGRALTMTLEPRLYYVYTPYRDQSNIPLFDTGMFGMGISQIFAPNTFVGNDRFADNNKVTVGFTSRIIDQETGAERLRTVVAQRIDLDTQRVGLNGNLTPNPNSGANKYSDLLMGVSTRLADNLNLDLFNQHNTQDNRAVQTTLTATYRPSPRRMINYSYRYSSPMETMTTNTKVHQNEVSGQWPLTKKVNVIGRWNFDQISHKTLNSLAGMEYDEECWALRVAVQRFVNTSQLATSQIFFQLEFKGLSGFGNNPASVMRLNIPGYSPSSSPRPMGSPFERYE